MGVELTFDESPDIEEEKYEWGGSKGDKRSALIGIYDVYFVSYGVFQE